MSEELAGNLLVTQSGEPTAVTNAILAGVVTEALNHGAIEEIYGCLNGVTGLLREDIVDLAEESQQVIRGLRYTPGAALGSGSGDALQSDDMVERVVRVLEAQNIRFLVQIGDVSSHGDTRKILEKAASIGYQLRVLAIPQGIDNGMPVTDHTPGYGSAIKFIATTTQQIGTDLASRSRHNLIAVIEVEDQSGWLVAGSTVTRPRNQPNDPPHILCLPNQPFTAQSFLEQVQNALKQSGHCVIVSGESLVDSDGNFLSVDQVAGRHIGAGEYIRDLLQEHLGLTTEVCRLGKLTRTAAGCLSGSDNEEAFTLGKQAVERTVRGESGKILTLMRSETDTYVPEVGTLDLSELTDQARAFPADWINEDGISLRHPYFKYAIPLVQGEVELPYENGAARFVKLSRNRVERQLDSYAGV